jgi:hypothetical protein
MTRPGRLLVVAAVATLACCTALATDDDDYVPPPAAFDCAMRKLAFEYGQALLPRLGGFGALRAALGLDNATAGACSVAATAPVAAATAAAPTGRGGGRTAAVLPAAAVYVAPLAPPGGDGSVGRPLRSLHLAVERALGTAARTVVLRGGPGAAGVHYLPGPLELTARHSGLTIMGFPGEQKPVVSGGTALDVRWTAHDTRGGKNVWVADVGAQVKTVPGLQINGMRATRARYPNLPGGIEVSCGYGCMIPGGSASWTPPAPPRSPAVFYQDSDPRHDRNDSAGWFAHYGIGEGGACAVYDPPVGYWCGQGIPGDPFRTPSGVTPNASALPHAPYKDASQAIFNVWRPLRWSNWMFEVGDYDAGRNNFTFGYGGFQGARGNDQGGDWFVENVFEELDHPGEFFHDEKTGKLYLFHNGTGAPPADATVVAPQLKVLVNVSGTQWDPVKDLKLAGIAYTATAYTYMDPHAVPSGGDWALERMAAVFLQGTEDALVDGCTFERLDGNGVMISGYSRRATVQNSDFAYLGGNAMAAWGYTNETAADPGRPGVTLTNYPGAGIDGTDGEHPRFTTIRGNLAREVGLYEKQSSFFVQAKTAETSIVGNVFFNGPRAGINANDGFGGGDEISHNLVFSTCRESGDHGPYNSWDRQPFLTDVLDGTPSVTPAAREIHHNFFIDNYSPQENVDNDDGSQYYNTHHNFLVYGSTGMKSDVSTGSYLCARKSRCVLLRSHPRILTLSRPYHHALCLCSSAVTTTTTTTTFTPLCPMLPTSSRRRWRTGTRTSSTTTAW